MSKKKQKLSVEHAVLSMFEAMYDEIAAAAVVALYKARDKAVRTLARKYKIDP